ncbi:unnamed protein product [Fasciola hepatica]|uniref:Uncharacterized protein n=1 Tax=Fasciola hepatica TaxID=6192 RepID=A0ABC9HGV2_FASHE
MLDGPLLNPVKKEERSRRSSNQHVTGVFKCGTNIGLMQQKMSWYKEASGAQQKTNFVASTMNELRYDRAGSKQTLDNYGPVSLKLRLCNCLKLIPRKQFCLYLIDNELTTPAQYKFVNNKITRLTDLPMLLEKTAQKLDAGTAMEIVILINVNTADKQTRSSLECTICTGKTTNENSRLWYNTSAEDDGSDRQKRDVQGVHLSVSRFTEKLQMNRPNKIVIKMFIFWMRIIHESSL